MRDPIVRKIIKVRLSQQIIDYLSVLGNPEDVLAILADHAEQGVRRPGAWEREWVIQCFGEDFLDRIEPIPDLHYHNDRPRTGDDK